MPTATEPTTAEKLAQIAYTTFAERREIECVWDDLEEKPKSDWVAAVAAAVRASQRSLAS